jgi:hypothetical protein
MWERRLSSQIFCSLKYSPIIRQNRYLNSPQLQKHANGTPGEQVGGEAGMLKALLLQQLNACVLQSFVATHPTNWLELKAVEIELLQHTCPPVVRKRQFPEAHCVFDVQGAKSGKVPPTDCAINALGATTEEINGNAIIELNPTLRIISRRFSPPKLISNASLFSSKLSFFNPSNANQTNSWETSIFNFLLNSSAMSATEFLPSHNCQTIAEVWFRQKALLICKS